MVDFSQIKKNYMFIGLGKVQNMSFLRSKMIHIMSPFICNNHLLFTFQIKMAVNDTQFDTRISSDAMTKLFIFFFTEMLFDALMSMANN